MANEPNNGKSAIDHLALAALGEEALVKRLATLLTKTEPQQRYVRRATTVFDRYTRADVRGVVHAWVPPRRRKGLIEKVIAAAKAAKELRHKRRQEKSTGADPMEHKRRIVEELSERGEHISFEKYVSYFKQFYIERERTGYHSSFIITHGVICTTSSVGYPPKSIMVTVIWPNTFPRLTWEVPATDNAKLTAAKVRETFPDVVAAMTKHVAAWKKAHQEDQPESGGQERNGCSTDEVPRLP